MTANALAIPHATIKSHFALEMGWPRESAAWGTTRDSDFDLILDKGLRQFYRPPPVLGERKSHNWSFLFPKAELELTVSYATGTVAVASGVVTLTGGTFPSWAAQGDLWLTDDSQTRQYTVNTRDGDTQVTLDDLTVDVTAGETYELIRRYYDLPDDFGGMRSQGFTYRRDEQQVGGGIRIVGERMIRERDRSYNTGNYPEMASLVTVPPTATQSSRTRVTFWPLPQQTSFVEYRYEAIPPKVTAAAPYHYGGAQHSETVLASVIDQGYQVIHASAEKREYFMDRLRQSVMQDRRQYTSDYIGRGVKSRGGGGNYGTSLDQFRRDSNVDDINLSFG